MSETKFTPGPWELCDRGDYGDFDGNSRVILGDDRRIAVVHDNGSAENAASARLIAQAPAMYEALERLVEAETFGGLASFQQAREHAAKVLRAARGET